MDVSVDIAGSNYFSLNFKLWNHDLKNTGCIFALVTFAKHCSDHLQIIVSFSNLLYLSSLLIKGDLDLIRILAGILISRSYAGQGQSHT